MQLKGSMSLRLLRQYGNYLLVEEENISEWISFLLPPYIPHCPRRAIGTVGLVDEESRGSNTPGKSNVTLTILDLALWTCQQCKYLLNLKRWQVESLEAEIESILVEGAMEIPDHCPNCKKPIPNHHHHGYGESVKCVF